MFKLIKYSLPFILILITLPFICEKILREVPNDYKLKANYIKQKGEKIETLILGSSHTFYGVNPHMLKNSYNLAHSSKSYDLDAAILEKNSKYLPRLKTIILPSSYFSFVHTVDNSTQRNLLKNYILYYDLNLNEYSLNLNSELFSLPLKENISKIFNKPNLISIDEKGFIKKRKLFKSEKYYSNETVKKHTKKIDFNQVNKNYLGLSKILDYAKKNKIKVILVSTPVAPMYKKYIDKSQYDHWQESTKSLINEYEEVVWVDFFNNDSAFEKSDFVDTDHLSLKGANKVTNELQKYIN